MTTEPPRPFHRWRINEDPSFSARALDYCLACGVRRYPARLRALSIAAGPCPGDRSWWDAEGADTPKDARP